MTVGFYGDQCALRKLFLQLIQCSDHALQHRFGNNILGSELHYARPGFFGACKNGSEIQVVREEDVPIGSTPTENFHVRRGRRSDV